MLKQNKFIISCNNLEKSYGELSVIKKSTFSLQEGEKVGLVGPNGGGKSTILKIIAGIEEKSSGKVEKKKNISIGYIPQGFSLYLDQTINDYIGKEKDISELSKKLNLKDLPLDRKIRNLSGGEKTKLALIKILISDYDLFLLDEPTNNLDIDALEILEDFIIKSKKTFIIISHDRMFLDKTVKKIIGINEFTKETKVYDGGFSDFLDIRKSEIEEEWKKYNDGLQKKKSMEIVISNKLKKSANMSKKEPRDNDKMVRNFKINTGQRATQREAMLLKKKLENTDFQEKPTSLLPLKINFETGERSGDKVFEIKKIVKRFKNKTIGPIDLKVLYGEKVLILGKNGTGKSTLLKMVLGEIKQDSGEIEIGTRIIFGYLPQEEEFSKKSNVLEIFKKEIQIEEGLARRTLNRFRLNEEDLKKNIDELSHGERSRFILAIMMTKKPNCLILDEPTNHLDLEVLTELENSLVSYPGTTIVVSHDRYFINKINFNKIYTLDDSGIKEISNYKKYK